MVGSSMAVNGAREGRLEAYLQTRRDTASLTIESGMTSGDECSLSLLYYPRCSL